MNNYPSNETYTLSRWRIVTPILVTFALIFLLSLEALPVFSKEQPESITDQPALSLLQATVTPTPTLESSLSDTTLQPTATLTPTLQSDLLALNTTLQNLAYEDVTLNSPFGTTTYQFRVPQHWRILGDSNVLLLDISYDYRGLDRDLPPPGVFGKLTILLDNEPIETLIIEEELQHKILQISLPASLFLPEQTTYQITVLFDANLICETAHEAELVIHSASSQLLLNYELIPLVSDLSNYPLPFFQRSSFLSDDTKFVISAPPTNHEATSAIRVAAKLGELTNNLLPISTTFDIDMADLVSGPEIAIDEHLIVIGQPDNNQLLPLLNEATTLPISLVERQMELRSQGPTIITSGQIFDYIITATNTTTQEATVSMVDTIPQFTQVANCDPSCQATTDGIVTWNNIRLDPEESNSFILTLQTVEFTPTEDKISIDNTVTLLNNNDPINVNTLSASIGNDNNQPDLSEVTNGSASNYFFVYNGLAVAEKDGIIQEVVSPWSTDRAILIITGLDEAAVEKASLAMSSETHLPGLAGSVALVKDAIVPNGDTGTAPLLTNLTFAELGYPDRILQGGFSQSVEYRFTLPYGWQPGTQDYLDLYFGHTQIMDFSTSSLTVNVNRSPVTTILLSEETAVDGNIRIDLSTAPLTPGNSNRITVDVNIQPLQAGCAQDVDNAWFTIKANSAISLFRTDLRDVPLNLRNFPFPFNDQPTLSNLLFALPETPTVEQWTQTLNLATILGASAEGQIIAPLGVLGNVTDEQMLSQYHIIAIGQPTVNPLMQQANDKLPQPFVPNTNEIQHKIGDVIFRISSNVDLGLVQLLRSPWNETRAFLAITGTTAEGVELATETVLNRPRGFQDTLVLIQGERIEAIDVSGLLESGLGRAVAEAVVTQTITSTTELNPTPTLAIESTPTGTPDDDQEEISSNNSRPVWLIPFIVGSLIAVVAIFAIALWQARRRRQ